MTAHKNKRIRSQGHSSASPMSPEDFLVGKAINQSVNRFFAQACVYGHIGPREMPSIGIGEDPRIVSDELD